MSGRPLHFERRGTGPALMILHGYTGSAGSMRAVSQAFAGDYMLANVTCNALNGNQLTPIIKEWGHSHLYVNQMPIFVNPTNNTVAPRAFWIGKIRKHTFVNRNIIGVNDTVAEAGVGIMLFGGIPDDLS